ncbi:MAG TPA: 6-phosphogluconolactonase [Candidatus Polarisedimenticolaceae bacterium]|nr:6-phosphogluconolactonase [Candidatus Polarisedimenticolaceae bacterium]
MRLRLIADPDELAHTAADRIATAARACVARTGRFTFAASGGRTPWQVFRRLAERDLPWHGFHLLQVDERVAPDGDPARNLTHLERSLLAHAPLPADNVHAMPVGAVDLEHAAADYGRILDRLCGGRIDLVHLGLGDDGHTASLVPGDAVLAVTDRDVALTRSSYAGHRRMTLTFPALARARSILWIVTGDGKAAALVGLLAGDRTIPAARVPREPATILADASAAALNR